MFHSVCASIGGFSNHIRWILLLSKEYNNPALLNANSFLRLKQRFPIEASEKVSFIKNNVYCEKRNHENWLKYETYYRGPLDYIICIGHNIHTVSKHIKDNQKHKILVSKLDPISCYENYKRFNPQLNGVLAENFLKEVKKDLHDIETYNIKKNETLLILNGNDLYKKELDYNLYLKMINFFELEDVYSHANIVHGMWFALHNNA